MTIACPLTSALQLLKWPDGLDGLIAIAVILALVVAIYIRQGHNTVLERMLAENDFGSPEVFRGNLIVIDYRPRVFLKLGPDTAPVTWWNRVSRWIWAPKFRPLFVAPVQEADFDGSARQITLRTKKGSRLARFNEF
jgi:hypothetical protein